MVDISSVCVCALKNITSKFSGENFALKIICGKYYIIQVHINNLLIDCKFQYKNIFFQFNGRNLGKHKIKTLCRSLMNAFFMFFVYFVFYTFLKLFSTTWS